MNKEFNIKRIGVGIEDFLKFNETPELIKTYNAKDLINEYKDFRKISRFKAYKEFVNIKD